VLCVHSNDATKKTNKHTDLIYIGNFESASKETIENLKSKHIGYIINVCENDHSKARKDLFIV
jgi:hypothetical protein